MLQVLLSDSHESVQSLRVPRRGWGYSQRCRRNLRGIHCNGGRRRPTEILVKDYIKKENLSKDGVEILDVEEVPIDQEGVLGLVVD